MAFNTKLNLDNSHSLQISGQTLTLSGNTQVATTGDLRYVVHPTFIDNTQVVDKKYVDDNVLTATGSSVYHLQSPSVCTVGGLIAGAVLTGKTVSCILQDILVPELFPTVHTAQSTSIGLSVVNGSVCEIGAVINQTVTGTFSRGAETPAYCGASGFKSGCACAYSFTGTGMPSGYQACATSTAANTANSYAVIAGSQSWTVSTKYGCGDQPYGSKGTPYLTPLVSGCTAAASASITGILPWFWGVNASNVITSNIITGGTKSVTAVAASTSICFNSITQYLWFAAPNGCTAKTKWWVCAANAGNIGGTGELWAASCSVSVTSGQGCWSGCAYNVYVTCGITTTANNVPMCLYY